MKAFLKILLYQPLFNLFILIVALLPNHNVGLAIIILTLAIRLLLAPLRKKSMESQLKTRDLQPELKRIQEKYKNDRQALSMATMQMYKDKGVNPASGCLPMVLHIIVLLALYSVFRHGWGPEQQEVLYSFIKMPSEINPSFLWIKDLTKVDSTYILPILAGGAQFLYSKALFATMPQPASTGKGGTEDMAQIMNKQLMYMGPVMTVLIGRTFPAALSLYWLAGTLFDWYQQVTFTKHFSQITVSNKVNVSVRKKGKETV